MQPHVAERIQTLAQAIRARDLDGLMAHYAPNVIVFDLRPPPRVEGAAAYGRNFAAWFAQVEGTIGFDVEHLQVDSAGDTAFCHYIAHVGFTARDGRAVDYRVRVTAGLREIGARWLITHEHISVSLSSQLLGDAIAQGNA